MNKDLFESQWSQIKPILRDKWSNLTDEDIRQINGRYDQLIAKIQQRYGYSRDVAEDEVRNWNFDRTRTYSTREDDSWKTKRASADDNGWLKWLLGLGIPLLLIGGYLIHHNAKEREEVEAGRTYTATEERMITETPEDRLISQSIRNALVENGALATERNIRIETQNGVVTIRGFVTTPQERDQIIRTIRNIRNVRQVNNQLVVK